MRSYGFVIAHASQQHTAGLGLLEDILNVLRSPVVIIPIIKRISADVQCAGRAEDHAAMAANAVFLVGNNRIFACVEAVYVEAALVDTHLALNAAIAISFHDEH